MDEEANEEAEEEEAAELANSQLPDSPSGVAINDFVPPKPPNDEKDRLSIKSDDYGARVPRRLSVGHRSGKKVGVSFRLRITINFTMFHHIAYTWIKINLSVKRFTMLFIVFIDILPW